MGSSSQRPRQRTSTSCTECRRRKQKCNQAKDRPCNNCARRYPPVACIYDVGNSRDPQVERIIDLNEECTTSDDIQPVYRTASHNSHSSYIPISSEAYAHPSSTYYSPASTATTTSYWPDQDSTWNSHYSAPPSSNYDAPYYTVSTPQTRGQPYDAGYFATEYPAAYSQQSPWYAVGSSDSRNYVQNGTTYEDYDQPSLGSIRRSGNAAHYPPLGTDHA